jgi:tRNA U38,U39,U40 pseudouridine synthase TruA
MSGQYVWLEYYFAAAGKNCKSDELQYQKKHVHGAQPSQDQVDSLQGSLEAAVQSAASQKNVAYPGDAAVRAGRTVKTRSEH